MIKSLTAVLIAFTVVLAAAAAVIAAGLYDVSATSGHTQPVYSLLEITMRRSIQNRARAIVVPSLSSAETPAHGAACYRDHCEQCHGGPGVAPKSIGKSMQPLPGFLMDASTKWQPREIYLIVRDGIKMSGMPAWGWHLGENDLWSTVAFVERLPELSPPAYMAALEDARALQCVGTEIDAGKASGLDSTQQARVALRQYACPACHLIPGIAGPAFRLGPPLDEFAKRAMIAGRLANTPENLVLWIKAPRSVNPNTAMPDMGVTDAHARLMAAYLLSLR
jgi:mono/diheme cytochrome c family protein